MIETIQLDENLPQNATLFLLYVFGKAEEAQYKFTTVDVKQTQEGIKINQAKYCESFKEIEVKDKRNMERELTWRVQTV